MSRVLVVWAFLLLPGCIQLAPLEAAVCDRDHGCPGGGHYCTNGGQCERMRPDPVLECEAHTDCPLDLYCDMAGNNHCFQCLADHQCPPGKVCYGRVCDEPGPLAGGTP